MAERAETQLCHPATTGCFAVRRDRGVANSSKASCRKPALIPLSAGAFSYDPFDNFWVSDLRTGIGADKLLGYFSPLAFRDFPVADLWSKSRPEISASIADRCDSAIEMP
ncbi:hypothetical protein [Mesorhizobium atlanticum]|uniref:hypothetical protein n=1 Tax=Mesorhizobium atlanticum TaxID=2233532 RepID=UPI0011BF79F2|nr:hypothetical protein [Mesorhizobium atlanticum]